MKRVGKIFLFLTLFLYGQVAFADVIITEIMYDVSGTDTDREWLEIYNAGEEGVDISKYKFFESSANHALSLFEGEAVLPKDGYAIIASNPTKFKTDWPAFTGILFDSSFSLSNESETLVIKDGNLEVTDEVTYDTSLGAGGDGKSLSKINTTWVVAEPTPGKANQIVADTNAAQDTTTISAVSTNTSTVVSPTTKNISIDLSVDNPVIVNAPTHFEATVFGVNDEKLVYGKLVWNFGDGSTLTTPLYGYEPITHIYFYSGTYTVTVEYFAGEYVPKPHAQKRILLQAVDAPIVISRIGTEQEFFIELTNASNYDVDVSLWQLYTGEQEFLIPQNTFLSKKQKIIFSPKVTRLMYTSTQDVILKNQNKDTVFVYSSNTRAFSKNTVQQSLVPSKRVLETQEKPTTQTKNEYVDLSQEVMLAQAEKFSGAVNKNVLIYIIILVVVGVACMWVLGLRTEQRKDESDFEIVDE